MNDTPDHQTERRRQFLEKAGAAYDLMFDPQLAGGLVTFDQREQRAREVGQQLIVTLLAEHANQDAAADPDPQTPPPCPRCQRPGRRVTPAAEELPPRVVSTCAGEVTLRRARFRCPACRVVFFPPG